MSRRRRGLTLIELLFTTLLFMLLFFMIWYFFRSGRSTLESTRRKLDASQRTHIRFEYLRHDLERSNMAWAAPEPEKETEREKKLGGGHLLFAEKKEYLFRPETGRLYVGGRPTPGKYREVRFFGQDQFRIKFLISVDKAHNPPSGKPEFRERSTLVSTVFVEPQAEELRERSHVWEDSHLWCVRGGSIHYGFND